MVIINPTIFKFFKHPFQELAGFPELVFDHQHSGKLLTISAVLHKLMHSVRLPGIYITEDGLVIHFCLKRCSISVLGISSLKLTEPC